MEMSLSALFKNGALERASLEATTHRAALLAVEPHPAAEGGAAALPAATPNGDGAAAAGAEADVQVHYFFFAVR
jgi:hypothetical protein